MNVSSDDRLDDEIRTSLATEAREVEPDTDAAWERFDTARRRARWLRPAPFVVAAAAAAVVLIAALVAADDEQAVVTDPADTTAPDPTTTTTSDAEETTTTTSIFVAPPVPSEPPQLYAVVMEDGRLVLLDRAGHVQRQLAHVGDPRETPPEGSPQFVDAVDISPDGRWVYYSECCEPASGVTYRVPTSGEDHAERVAEGYAPAVSPDGRWLAMTTADHLRILDLRAPEDPIITAELPSCCGQSIVWSRDAARLAVIVSPGSADVDPVIVEAAFNGTSLRILDEPQPGAFAHYLPDGRLIVLDVANPLGLRALSTDASTSWILQLTEGGALQYRSADALDSPPAELGSGYIAAGW